MTPKTTSQELRELFEARKAAHPGESEQASIAAIESDPANADLRRRILAEPSLVYPDRRGSDYVSLSERTTTMASTKSPSEQVADLVKAYRADNPGTLIAAAFAAVRLANPALWAQYVAERGGPVPVTTATPPRAIGSQSSQDGVAMVRKVGAALPADSATLAEGAPKRLADARSAWMIAHGVTGSKGIAQADKALKLSEPALYTDYAAYAETQYSRPNR